MNRMGLLALCWALVLGGSVYGNEGTHDGHEHPAEAYYTCAMHPDVRQSKPGKCPICNMNLTKVEDGGDDDDADGLAGSERAAASAQEVIAKVKLRKSQLEHFNPSFFPVTSMKMTKKVRLLGAVKQSEDRDSHIAARVGGRVEKVFVKSTGSFIKQGDPVVRLYSPKLITAGEEYLISRRSYGASKKDEFKNLMVQAEKRLRLWGIKPFQYKNWYRQGRVPKNIIIHSPSTGIVRKKMATVGRYFKEGEHFFELSDLTDVWVEMDVYEHDAGVIKMGQKVDLEFTALPGETVHSEVDFLAPVLDTRSRTLKIRATVENPQGTIKPGMIADATLEIVFDGEPLVVPRTAVIDTGKRKVVWVKQSGRTYHARIIHTGRESEGYMEIKDGLKEGDEVVIDGNFLLDAQAQLFGGYSEMTSSEPHQHHQH